MESLTHWKYFMPQMKKMLFINEIQLHEERKYLQKKKTQISLQDQTISHLEYLKNIVSS